MAGEKRTVLFNVSSAKTLRNLFVGNASKAFRESEFTPGFSLRNALEAFPTECVPVFLHIIVVFLPNTHVIYDE
jgi:hypothetical protein